MTYDQMTIEELQLKKEKLLDEINSLNNEINEDRDLIENDRFMHYTDKKELENEIIFYHLQINKIKDEIAIIEESIAKRVVKKLN